MLILEAGQIVKVTEVIDLSPHAIIEKGEHGLVVWSDGAGNADIKMSRHHKGLGEWDNCIWTIAPYTAAVESALTVLEKIAA